MDGPLKYGQCDLAIFSGNDDQGSPEVSHDRADHVIIDDQDTSMCCLWPCRVDIERPTGPRLRWQMNENGGAFAFGPLELNGPVVV